MKPFVVPRAAYAYDVDDVSRETGLDVSGEPSLTQQQFAKEVDINEIVRRFGITGQMPDVVVMPHSGDFSDVPDFHTAMNLIRQAEEGFMQVPAEIRARFNNDPGQFMAFFEDEKNRDEAIKLGLVIKPPERDRDGGEVVKPE